MSVSAGLCHSPDAASNRIVHRHANQCAVHDLEISKDMENSVIKITQTDSLETRTCHVPNVHITACSDSIGTIGLIVGEFFDLPIGGKIEIEVAE